MLFERFLSAERAEPPDIDVDFEHERREEVIQEIYADVRARSRRDGERGHLATAARSALRDVGKVFGFSLEQVDRARRDRLAGGTADGVAAPSGSPTRASTPATRASAMVLAMARAIQGFPRHLSIHVGGFVLVVEPLVERRADRDRPRWRTAPIIPWDKDDIDTLGFFKVDVLGLGHAHRDPQGARAGAARRARARGERDRSARADPARGPGRLRRALRGRHRGRLPDREPRADGDAAAPQARGRSTTSSSRSRSCGPGPIQGGMVHPYLRRRTGEEQVDCPHPMPRADPRAHARRAALPGAGDAASRSCGAGYTGGEADQLRRDMAAWRRNGNARASPRAPPRGLRRARHLARVRRAPVRSRSTASPSTASPRATPRASRSSSTRARGSRCTTPRSSRAALLNSQPMGFYSPVDDLRGRAAARRRGARAVRR